MVARSAALLIVDSLVESPDEPASTREAFVTRREDSPLPINSAIA